MSYTERLVTARKRHRCEQYPSTLCGKWIEPGDDYVRAVAFPGDVTDHIWVLRLCVPCATQYGKSLPPRRKAAPCQ